jgi:hypothetical protein
MNILPIRIIIYGICYFFPINFSHMYLNLHSSGIKLFPPNIIQSPCWNQSHCNVSAVCSQPMRRRGNVGWWPMKNARFSAASDDDCARLWAALGKRFAQPPLISQRIETLHFRNGDPEQKGGNINIFAQCAEIRTRPVLFYPWIRYPDPGWTFHRLFLGELRNNFYG